MGSRNTAANSMSSRRVVNTPADNSLGTTTGPDDWYRNPAWLPLPTLTETDQRMVGLYPVFPTTDGTGNYVAFICAGAFTVDWGDGTVENYATNSTASHNYNYNSSQFVGTEAPVTFTASTNTVNRTAHGYKDGQKIVFASVSAATGLYANAPYWVMNATADTFQLSDSSGVITAVTIAANGTGNLLPYRQAIISVTPQASNSLSTINFNVRHPLQVISPVPSMNWLDIAVASNNLSSMTIGAASPVVYLRMLEQFSVIKSAVTNWSYFFASCTALRSVPTFYVVPPSTSQSSWTFMFQGCKSLVTAPWINFTGQVGDLTSLFSSCTSLRNVPLYDWSKITITQQTFATCSALKNVPAFDLQKVTNPASMFTSCGALTTVPGFDLRAAVGTSSMFTNCQSLKAVGKMNLSACLNTSSMFSGCVSLRSLPALDLPVATTLTQMFANCNTMERAPVINAPNANNIDSLFSGCNSISYIPPETTNWPKVTSLTSWLNACNSLKHLPPVNLPNCPSPNTAFSGIPNLERIVIKALAANVTSISGMFSNSGSLVSIKMPAVGNTCTTMTSAFSGCSSLAEFPQIDMSGVTVASSLSNIFSNCLMMPSLSHVTTPPNYSLTIGPGGTMPVAALQEFIDRLPIAAVTQTLTTTNCTPARIAISTTGTWLASAKSITVANATGIVVGYTVVAGGISTYNSATSITVDVSTSTFTKTGHGFAEGKSVAFNSVSTVTGISSRVRYYMVNVTTDTFQVSATQGGAAITLGGSGTTVTITWPTYVTAVNGTTITLSDYPTGDRTSYAVTFQNFDPFLGNIRNWNVY